MNRAAGFAALLLSLAVTPTFAAGWEYDGAIDVTPAHGERVFHHLDSSGRKSVAAGHGLVAVAWEDNRDGTPRCYISAKAYDATLFNADAAVSGKEDCYEPSVAVVGPQRFLVVFEEGGRVQARVVAWIDGVARPGEPVALGKNESSQASVGVNGDVVYATWAEKEGRFARVRVARLAIKDRTASVVYSTVADAGELQDDQLYPSVAPGTKGNVVVAWEDRRKGHTLILQAYSADGRQFEPFRQVNETRNAAVPQTRSRTRNLGKGPGAMRAALARQDDQRVGIVWMDKRDFLSGYDIYAAFSTDGGRKFGKNQKAQDSFGDTNAQWHPAIAASGDDVVIAWDDERDNTADIWLSWKVGDGWSDDVAPKPAAGPGAQSDPSVALDERGGLHLVWIDRQEANGPTRLRYLFGHR
jgi:hypothetical protein